MDIKVKVVEAGMLPLATFNRDGQPRLVKTDTPPWDWPPRVLLEVSQEAARALAAHLGDEITITLPEAP